jgi:hypothetical protein
MTPEFEKNEKGNIITKPVIGFNSAPMAGMFVLLAIRYTDSPEEAQRGESRQIQLILTIQQAQEIAGSLKRQTERVLAGLPPGKSPN